MDGPETGYEVAHRIITLAFRKTPDRLSNTKNGSFPTHYRILLKSLQKRYCMPETHVAMARYAHSAWLKSLAWLATLPD